MRVFALISALLALGATQQGPPMRLKTGDTVTVTVSGSTTVTGYGGDYQIMPDGAIYGRGFGRLTLAGKTWQEALQAIRAGLHNYVRSDQIDMSIKDIRRDVVYLVGMNGGKGPIDLAPKQSLRQLLSAAPLDENADLVEVELFRHGVKVCDDNVAKLLSGDPSVPDQELQPDDVVTLQPVDFVRIWVTGLVMKTGQLKVPAGTDVYRALAEAGGVKWPELEADTSLQQLGRVMLRRGPQTIELPVKADIGAKPVLLEAGDTITVVAPEERRITIAGEVNKPGEILMRGEHSLTGAIAMAGGCDPQGTLSDILILRKGEMYQIDATPPPGEKELNAFSLEAGDLVYVQRNVRSFVVLGEVAHPGRVFMQDGKTYRLTDALAEAGGLDSRGSFRRVFVAHPGPGGKVVVSEYNLDEYLKDGKAAANPLIKPGECILFGQPKGFTIASATQVLSSALLFESVTRVGK